MNQRNSLWIFGDSYAADHPHCAWQWHKLLAPKLDLDLRIVAQFGVSNEWICMQLMDWYVGNLIKPGDVVIVNQTSCGRHWFLQDFPELSNWYHSPPPPGYGVTQEQLTAIEMYYKHIQQGTVDSWKYDATSAWLNHYNNKLAQQGITMLTLPGFGHATDIYPQGPVPVKGDLFSAVCTPEFTSQKAMDAYYARPFTDQRINHMMKDNHAILALALEQGIKKQMPIDLNAQPWRLGVLSIGTEAALKDQISQKHFSLETQRAQK